MLDLSQLQYLEKARMIPERSRNVLIRLDTGAYFLNALCIVDTI